MLELVIYTEICIHKTKTNIYKILINGIHSESLPRALFLIPREVSGTLKYPILLNNVSVVSA